MRLHISSTSCLKNRAASYLSNESQVATSVCTPCFGPPTRQLDTTRLRQVDSVYTRSTPLMEAVKIGRLDLIECLIAAGARLDVQVGFICRDVPSLD